ncbi:MAG: vitamin K epoxide reductase family protein [Verrucomicrobia bacterium]|nr:vitamin K epoxide reductase family protein [Verrucomicrobiota bacterium]
MRVNSKLGPFLFIGIGLWLFTLPLTFHYCHQHLGISDLITGILFVLLGVLGITAAHTRWIIGAAVLGLWLQAAPLFLWAPHAFMYLNDTLVGLVALCLALHLLGSEKASTRSERPVGWSYNPSDWLPRLITVGLAMVAWFCARYMAVFQLGYIDQVWDPIFNQGTYEVITSKISKDFMISDAGLGALAYSLEAVLGWQGGKNRFATMPWVVCAYGILVIPVSLVSICLIILQPVAVGAWCSWCLTIAICMLVMIVLTAGEFVATIQYLIEQTKKRKSFWEVFWKGGLPAQEREAGKKAVPNLWGITPHWTLVASALIGLWLMSSPSLIPTSAAVAMSHYVAGPVLVVFSVLALPEVFRSIRYVNVLIGLGLLTSIGFCQETNLFSTIQSLLLSLFIIILALPRGKILGRYGTWTRWIK